jgi:hypothetical protein
VGSSSRDKQQLSLWWQMNTSCLGAQSVLVSLCTPSTYVTPHLCCCCCCRAVILPFHTAVDNTVGQLGMWTLHTQHICNPITCAAAAAFAVIPPFHDAVDNTVGQLTRGISARSTFLIASPVLLLLLPRSDRPFHNAVDNAVCQLACGICTNSTLITLCITRAAAVQ